MAENDLHTLAVRSKTSSGNEFINTFSFREGASVAGTPAVTLASDFNTTAMAAYRSCITSLITPYQIDVHDVAPGTAATTVYPIPSPSAGARTGDALAPQLSAVITLRTALGGRAYRGRVYMPPTVESDQTFGTWETGYVSSLQGFVDILVGRYITNAATSKFRWVVVSRQLDKVARPTPIGTDVSAVQVRTAVCTQRRRRAGVGI